ncbi:alpha-ketoglutarate-dependent dioxygenase alkB homolog 4 isoform X2 [Mesoplodon densirostris]|uniref:alpha-ketoglutarate-dependent dioxygenase alkB homolog 4 isoform X2 n=1 Tax=Mesoplodon densirostris TaxID=48708 RepID=UPI0028DD1B84|nr:alpha-ketoglutarate-dependent dioxygenase alkB homolog 4 isoform X2 [Mesoplodon densirostris]
MAAAAVAAPEVLRECGCKGIRTCLICERQRGADPPWQHPPQKTHRFIYYADTGWAVGAEECDFEGWAFPFPGVTLIEDFVTPAEEAEMVRLMDRDPWKLSQSGRRKQTLLTDLSEARPRTLALQASHLNVNTEALPCPRRPCTGRQPDLCLQCCCLLSPRQSPPPPGFLGVSWPWPACPSLSACCCRGVGVARRSRRGPALGPALGRVEQGRRKTPPADGATLHEAGARGSRGAARCPPSLRPQT